jgi:hypothetical protein
VNCPACNTELTAGMTYCPTCRARGAAAAAVRPVSPPPPPTDRNERLFLVVACLLSAGVLAVPRLLRSKAFGPVGKTVLGVAATVNTAAAVALLVLACWKGPQLIMDWVRHMQRGF